MPIATSALLICKAIRSMLYSAMEFVIVLVGLAVAALLLAHLN
jgi:hypothetical protein